MTNRMIWLVFVTLSSSSCATLKSNKAVDAANMSSNSSDTDSPIVTSPEVHRIWVPDKIEGNKFVKGHFMFVIERGSVWTMP